MKFENNWRQKSIENLEKNIWGKAPEGSTHLVETCHHLRTIQIEKLRPQDVRMLIGQNIGLNFLIPVSLEILKDDIFIDTIFFPGDLLKAVLNVETKFWGLNPQLKKQLDDLLSGFSDEEKMNFKEGKFDNHTPS